MMPSPAVLVSSPFPIDSPQGNSVSARRIARRINAIGLHAVAREGYAGEDAQILIALHARRNLETVEAFRRLHPERKIIVVLTGTDLYTDLPAGDTRVIESMRAADSLVTYQDASLADVPEEFSDKALTIWKSVDLPIPDRLPLPPDSPITFSILAHLRRTKDPFLAAQALAHVPQSPVICIRHFGRLLDASLGEELAQHSEADPRYRWRDSLPRDEVAAIISSSHATINTGRTEGGSNAICESIVLGTPVLATRTPANVGFLGTGYRGYFPVGDTRALAGLIHDCCSSNGDLLAILAGQVNDRSHLFRPESESAGWKKLLGGS